MLLDTTHLKDIATSDFSLHHANDSLINRIKAIEKLNDNDVVIRYINSVGSQWPFLLIVIIGILFLVYRKQIELFFSNVQSIKGAAAGLSVEVSHSSVAKTLNSENELNDFNTKSIDNVSVVDDKTEHSKELGMFSTYLAMEENNLDEANRIFNDIQSRETQLSQIEENKIIFQYYKYLSGYTDALKEIILIGDSSNNIETKIKVDYYLILSYTYLGNYPKAIALALKSIDFAKRENLSNEKLKVLMVVEDAYEKSNQLTEYISLLLREVPSESKEDSLFKIFQKISEAYNKNKQTLESVLFLLKATDYVSNDKTALFNLAYRFSELDYNEMSLFYYKLLTKLNVDNASAYNNLAVAHSNLGLKGKAVSFYKESFKLGNTLAASNLAYSYLNAGFTEEAKDILDEAAKHKDVDANIWKAYDKLEEDSKNEHAILNNVTERAQIINTFFKFYVDTILKDESEGQFSFEEFVLNEKGNSVTTNVDKSIITIDYSDSTFEIYFPEQRNKVGICTALEVNKQGKSYRRDNYEGHYCYYNGELKVLLKYNNYILRQDTRLFEFSTQPE